MGMGDEGFVALERFLPVSDWDCACKVFGLLVPGCCRGQTSVRGSQKTGASEEVVEMANRINSFTQFFIFPGLISIHL